MATNNRLNYAPTNHAVIVGGASGAITSLSVGTDGQLLVGASAADPAFSASANADFTFGGSNSGATRTLTVSNTSNTASSMANALVTVGGGTAADATMQSVVSGVTTWTMGVDNSNADIFAIAGSTALGTTDVMQVQTTGEINYPLQSAFSARKTTTTTNQTGDGTVYTYTATSELFDQNNDFSSTTYTAPITGRVSLNMLFGLAGFGAGQTDGNITINTSNRNYLGLKWNMNNIATGTSSAMSNYCFADMDAGDTSTVTFVVSGGSKTVDIAGVSIVSYFTGSIIC